MNKKQRFSPRTVVVPLFAFLFFSAVLAACGGNNSPENSVTAVAEPTSVQSEAVEPTALPPTEEPPTEVPPTEVPTDEPTTEAPTDEASTGDTALAGDCANAFFPVVEGRVYTYSSSLAGFGVSNYTQTFSDVTDSSFTISINSGEGEPISYTWTCAEGGMLSPEFTQLPAGMEGIISIEFVEAEGVTLPSEDMMQPGQSWTTHYVAEATIADSGAGEMTIIQTFDLTNSVTSVEAVSVPAGDYDEAVRVDTVGSITMAFGDAAPSTPLEMNFTSWYVEDVGMVKQEFVSLLGSDPTNPSVTELLSIEDE